MHLNTYQSLAMRTARKTDVSERDCLTEAALGLCGEAGEFADAIKKAVFQGHIVLHKELAEEIGDCLWYCALAASSIGATLDDIAQGNVDKLRKRYPEGFDTARSLNREEKKG